MKIKFDGREYVIGRSYEFSDLPPIAQEEARASLPKDHSEFGYKYKLELQSWEAIRDDEFFQSLWEVNRDQEKAVRKIAKDISRRGLLSPPIGREGWHRTMALVGLQTDVPYFRMIRKGGGIGIRLILFPQPLPR